MTPREIDPPRWKASPSEAQAGVEARAGRLMRAAREHRPKVTVTFDDIRVSGRPARRSRYVGRFVVSGAAALSCLLILGSIALSRGWIAGRWRPVHWRRFLPAGPVRRSR